MTNMLNNTQISVNNGLLIILAESVRNSSKDIDFETLLNIGNIKDLLGLLDIDAQYCTLENFNEKTLIVFPLKLKKSITIIHKAQLQTLKLLQRKFNVKINILIVGGSNTDETLISDMNEFQGQIVNILTANDITADINMLHNINTNKKVKEKYLRLLDEVKLIDIQAFKIKNYKNIELKKEEFLNETIASATDVLNIYAYICSNNEELKSTEDIEQSIILAGEDEVKAWYGLFDAETLCKIFGIFIPRLSVDNYDFDQNILKKTISNIDLLQLLKNEESGQWFVKMFFLQPLFSSISTEEIKAILAILNQKTTEIKLNIDDDDCIKDLLKNIVDKRFVQLITA